jgi:hypothetical protein
MGVHGLIGCFSPLKKAYGRQIEDMIRAHIVHITKDDFFPAFHAVFNIAMTERTFEEGSKELDFFHSTPRV